MKHFIDGREEVCRDFLEEDLVRFVERQMVVDHHPLCPDEPQPDHQRLDVAELEVIKRLGQPVLDGLAFADGGGRLQLEDFLGQRISGVAADDADGVGRRLEDVDQGRDVADVTELGLELDPEGRRGDGLELGNFGAEVLEPTNR